MFLDWLWFIFFGWFRKAKPGPVTHAKARLRHMNIVLAWKDPTVRADGSALSPNELARINVGMRVAGAPDFSPFTTVGAGVQTATITDLPPGDYEFSLVPVDTQNPPKSGAAVVVSATIAVPVKSEPGSVTDATATVV